MHDVRYAGYYIESRSQTKSKRQIVQELKAKGVSSEDIEAAYEQAEGNSEEETILALVSRVSCADFSPQEIVILLVYAFAARTSAPAGRA